MFLLLFEDECYVNFLPLTYTKPVYELKCGAYTLCDRLWRALPEAKVALACRSYLAKVISKLRPQAYVNRPDELSEEILLVNGRALPLQSGLAELAVKGTVWVKDNELVACLLSGEEVRELWELIEQGRSNELLTKLKEEREVREATGLRLIDHLWELVELNPQLLGLDLSRNPGRIDGVVEDLAVIKGDRSRLTVEEGAEVEALSLIDLREGPVFIGKGSRIEAGSRVVGPVYIGRNVVVQGAFIRKGCHIGDGCRLGGGGEVEETVLHGYTNKYHFGFLGHSYIGEWVNLAAGTTNSDLKNTYGTVKVKEGGRPVDTGLLKLGCFIADHVKTSIGTYIYTGVKVGVGSHIHGFITQDVPSFTIWALSLGKRPVELRLQSAVETARRMCSRRGVVFGEEEAKVLEEVFKATEREREEVGVVKGEFKP
ncbi:MAG: hypothetical protein DRN06_00485 [Thermoprotei archaeon]|nr:MAG: hypothetical protein DRN06_00485 [Thermoprotei archaeon]